MYRIKTLAILIIVASMLLAACAQAAAPTAAPAQPAATQAPAAGAATFGAASCAPNCAYKDMTMCFPQLGAESDWRTADTASFKDEADKEWL